MRKRSKIAWLVVIILVLLGAIYWWFWSLGNLPTDVQPKIQLVVEKGTASIIRSGSQNKEGASDGMELQPGDQVMTDGGSAVDIMVFDRAVTRLDENSNLTITEASLNNTTFIDRWKLGAGRAWSRVLRLIDLDSVYEGQSSQVIATVRGTAFLLAASQDKISLLVDHAAVREAKVRNTKPEFIVGGQWMDFKPTGEVQSRGDISSTTTVSNDILQRINIEEDTWLNNNRQQDAQYLEKITTAIMASLGGSKGIKPDSWLYKVSRWSEGWHLSLAGKKAPELKSRYIGRQLGQVHDLISRGKSGLAYQMLSQIEKDIGTLIDGNQGSDYRTALKPVIGKALLAVSEIDPNSNVFRFKISMEDLYALAWEDVPAQTFYARSLSVDARLDEAERFKCELKDSDQVKEAINAVIQGMARQKNDFDKIKSGLTNNQRTILEEKMQVQGLRLDYLNKRLQACAVPGQGSELPGATATSTTATTTQTNPPGGQPNSSNSTAPTTQTQATTTKATTPTNPPVTQNPSSLGLIRIELFAQPNPANVGDKVNLFVKGYKSDGSTLDVTANAGFQINGSLGTLSGSVFQTSKAGSVTILATVNDSGKILSAQTSLAINQSVTLSRLTIQPTNISLKPGQSQPLTATAYYNNGFTKDVTSSVTWSLSNSLATMAGASIVAGNSAGGVTVAATYSDGGSKVSGDAYFQIVATAVTGLQ